MKTLIIFLLLSVPVLAKTIKIAPKYFECELTDNTTGKDSALATLRVFDDHLLAQSEFGFYTIKNESKFQRTKAETKNDISHNWYTQTQFKGHISAYESEYAKEKIKLPAETNKHITTTIYTRTEDDGLFIHIHHLWYSDEKITHYDSKGFCRKEKDLQPNLKNSLLIKKLKEEAALIQNLDKEFKSDGWKEQCLAKKDRTDCFVEKIKFIHNTSKFSVTAVTLLLSFGGGLYYADDKEKNKKEFLSILIQFIDSRSTPKSWGIENSDMELLDERMARKLKFQLAALRDR